MVAEDSLIAGLARRFPDEFSRGLGIGSGVIDTLEAFEAIGTIEDALVMTAHEVAAQVLVPEEIDNVRAAVILVGADTVVRSFFEHQESAT